jgi:hypothetical protein
MHQLLQTRYPQTPVAKVRSLSPSADILIKLEPALPPKSKTHIHKFVGYLSKRHTLNTTICTSKSIKAKSTEPSRLNLDILFFPHLFMM